MKPWLTARVPALDVNVRASVGSCIGGLDGLHDATSLRVSKDQSVDDDVELGRRLRMALDAGASLSGSHSGERTRARAPSFDLDAPVAILDEPFTD